MAQFGTVVDAKERKCRVKITITCDGDVTGTITGSLLTVTFDIHVHGECFCPPPWEADYFQWNKDSPGPYTLPPCTSTGGGSTGTWSGGFKAVIHRDTNDPCENGECDGEWETDQTITLTIELGDGPHSPDVCRAVNKRFLTRKIRNFFYNEVNGLGENHPLLRCNEPQEKDTSFLFTGTHIPL